MATRRRRPNIKKLRQYSQKAGVDLWAMDEVRFQQHGSRCRMWIPPEVKDPVVLHHPTRKSVGYFAALRCRDGRLVFRRQEHVFNAVTCWEFMQQLEHASRMASKQAVVILDNATFHHARLHAPWRQQVVDHLVFDFLPPYSPELNPIERVWKLTRKLCIHDQYFPTISAVIEAVETQFSAWANGSHDLTRLCAL